jgi:MOSC domain-containing protein YiiM
MIDGFSQLHHVQGRASIADLFPQGKRCGLYILYFLDGEIYAGQALDVTRRYVQHCKVHCDIVI